MDHNDVRHRLSDYIDGEVTPAEKEAVERHLAACRDCADALRELRKTVEHLRRVEELEPPAWMTGKVLARVRAEAEKRQSPLRRFLSALAAGRPVQALALVFIVVAASVLYLRISPAPREAKSPPGPAALRKEVSEDQTRTAAEAGSPSGQRARQKAERAERSSEPRPELRSEAAVPAEPAPERARTAAPESPVEQEGPAATDCLAPSPAVVTLSGVLAAESAGPSGRQVLVLLPDRPVCVETAGAGGRTVRSAPQRRIELLLDDAVAAKQAAAPFGTVRVRGSLVSGPDAGPAPPYLLKVLDISPKDQ